MNDEEIRIAIAGACGLEVIHDPRGPIDTRPSRYTLKRKVYYTPTAAATRRRSWPKSSTVPVVPRYTECLNAMHEAEKELVSSWQWNTYTSKLASVCGWNSGIHDARTMANVICSATARQRAEAFLRTFNLWKD